MKFDTVEAILFDLDGTLIEVDDSALQALAARLSPLAWLFSRRDPVRTLRRLMLAGEGVVNTSLVFLERLGFDYDHLLPTDRLRRLRGLGIEGDFKILPGVREMLESMSKRYQLGVVTNRAQRQTFAFLEQYRLRELFAAIITRQDTRRFKPHPAPLLHAAQTLGVPVERCVLVGDTAFDVRAARAAGTYAVGVLCGFGEPDDLEEADLILHHTSQLGEWL